jgi:hypothetical protein
VKLVSDLLCDGVLLILPPSCIKSISLPLITAERIVIGSAVPTAGGLSSSQRRVFEATVEVFHHTIGLQTVGCFLGLLHVEQVAQGGPQGEGERGTAVLM